METQFTQKEINSANGVIKRRRTNFEKKIRRTLPLFADIVISEYKDQNSLEHLQNKQVSRENTKKFWRDWRIKEREKTRACRAEVKSICANEQEFRLIMRRVVAFKAGNKMTRWQIFRDKLRQRSQPISEQADLVLAWLEQESEPVTHWDLWRRRGDGATPNEIGAALRELYSRELVLLIGAKLTKTDSGNVIPACAWILPRNT